MTLKKFQNLLPLAIISLAAAAAVSAQDQETLVLPVLSKGSAAAGKKVAVTPLEYAGTEVFHTLFLPEDWSPDGPKLPIIFEYTGNRFPASGSTGKVEDAALGFGLSGGKYIWVSLPYVSEKGTANEVTWWGDEDATVRYAKTNVPQIIKQYGADPNAVFLCGFSRGAIAVNYIGLHDDEIAGLWSAFVTHDHFDGARSWGTRWGAPLKRYQADAKERLARVGQRPYWVSQQGNHSASEMFVRSALDDVNNFQFAYVNVGSILGEFPNDTAKTSHTDRWLLKPSIERQAVWGWMRKVIQSAAQRSPKSLGLGELIFEDRFERSESQELRDEPGNEWTTSSDKTAAGHKQVDLRDGAMHIYTHAVANHATSVRHKFSFTDGSVALRFMLHDKGDSLKLNFTDLACKSVHAGHLFDAVVSPSQLTIEDRKMGVMDLKMRARLKAKTVTAEQRRQLATKKIVFPIQLPLNQWHEITVHIDGDIVSVEINGQSAGRHQSEGYAHEEKSMLRLLVAQKATVDDLRIWRRHPAQDQDPSGDIGSSTPERK